MKLIEEGHHYVYLYRDLKKKPRYVGYGKTTGRAVKHLSLSHNDNLNAFLQSQDFTLEIAGPFNDEQMARGVETALISALQPDCNIDPGQALWRFRPLGVPEIFAERLSLPALRKADFSKLQRKEKAAFLFVKISEKDFDEEDGTRFGYNPAYPPSDNQILERMDKWWQLGKHIAQWSSDPKKSPLVLIGINGRPGGQVIIGSAFVDRDSWHETKSENGFYVIPTLKTSGLDALSLRGRRISKEANIKFGAFFSQIFLILNPDGTTIGGNPDRGAKEQS